MLNPATLNLATLNSATQGEAHLHPTDRQPLHDSLPETSSAGDIGKLQPQAMPHRLRGLAQVPSDMITAPGSHNRITISQPRAAGEQHTGAGPAALLLLMLTLLTVTRGQRTAAQRTDAEVSEVQPEQSAEPDNTEPQPTATNTTQVAAPTSETNTPQSWQEKVLIFSTPILILGLPLALGALSTNGNGNNVPHWVEENNLTPEESKALLHAAKGYGFMLGSGVGLLIGAFFRGVIGGAIGQSIGGLDKKSIALIATAAELGLIFSGIGYGGIDCVSDARIIDDNNTSSCLLGPALATVLIPNAVVGLVATIEILSKDTM